MAPVPGGEKIELVDFNSPKLLDVRTDYSKSIMGESKEKDNTHSLLSKLNRNGGNKNYQLYYDVLSPSLWRQFTDIFKSKISQVLFNEDPKITQRKRATAILGLSNQQNVLQLPPAATGTYQPVLLGTNMDASLRRLITGEEGRDEHIKMENMIVINYNFVLDIGQMRYATSDRLVWNTGNIDRPFGKDELFTVRDVFTAMDMKHYDTFVDSGYSVIAGLSKVYKKYLYVAEKNALYKLDGVGGKLLVDSSQLREPNNWPKGLELISTRLPIIVRLEYDKQVNAGRDVVAVYNSGQFLAGLNDRMGGWMLFNFGDDNMIQTFGVNNNFDRWYPLDTSMMTFPFTEDRMLDMSFMNMAPDSDTIGLAYDLGSSDDYTLDVPVLAHWYYYFRSNDGPWSRSEYNYAYYLNRFNAELLRVGTRRFTDIDSSVYSPSFTPATSDSAPLILYNPITRAVYNRDNTTRLSRVIPASVSSLDMILSNYDLTRHILNAESGLDGLTYDFALKGFLQCNISAGTINYGNVQVFNQVIRNMPIYVGGWAPRFYREASPSPAIFGVIKPYMLVNLTNIQVSILQNSTVRNSLVGGFSVRRSNRVQPAQSAGYMEMFSDADVDPIYPVLLHPTTGRLLTSVGWQNIEIPIIPGVFLGKFHTTGYKPIIGASSPTQVVQLGFAINLMEWVRFDPIAMPSTWGHDSNNIFIIRTESNIYDRRGNRMSEAHIYGRYNGNRYDTGVGHRLGWSFPYWAPLEQGGGVTWDTGDNFVDVVDVL